MDIGVRKAHGGTKNVAGSLAVSVLLCWKPAASAGPCGHGGYKRCRVLIDTGSAVVRIGGVVDAVDAN